MNEINCKVISEVLEKLSVKTVKTCEFEEKYAEKDDRWWEELDDLGYQMSKQQYHVVCYFICKYYNGSSNISSCQKIKENTKACADCYIKKDYEDRISHNIVQPNAQTIYKGMQRPEMYMWIIEALNILGENQLSACFDDVIIAWDTNEHHSKKMSNVRTIIEKFCTWKEIENKINQLKIEV